MCTGLADAVKECIILADDDDWMSDVYLKSIVLAGGNNMFKGLEERLTAEMDKVKFEPYMTVKINFRCKHTLQHVRYGTVSLLILN